MYNHSILNWLLFGHLFILIAQLIWVKYCHLQSLSQITGVVGKVVLIKDLEEDVLFLLEIFLSCIYSTLLRFGVQLRFVDGLGFDLFQEVEEAMTQVLYVQLLFAANYDYENFLALSTKNKGYEFALSELTSLKSIDSNDEFMEFIDFIAEQ